jgi:hypothetical protein
VPVNGFQEDAMNVLMQLSRSAHQLQRRLPLPWQAPSEEGGEPDAGSFVLAVTLVSVAAAVVLVLGP